jgi:2-polyprenyl-3-methyl-5-hydroxy-6-metoxy-1,4-benzoquinol methylase
MASGKAQGSHKNLRAPLSLACGPRVLEPDPADPVQEVLDYDGLASRHRWQFVQPFVDLVADVRMEHGRVLDIGTGPGWIPIELGLHHPGWEIWALDASEEMLARARRHAAEAGVEQRVHFIHGNAVDLPFSAGQFDLVVSNYLLHHLEQPERFIAETVRVTCDGGKIIIKDLCRLPGWRAGLLALFARHALRYNAQQVRMYRESIGAALTCAEARETLTSWPSLMVRRHGFWGLEFVISN